MYVEINPILFADFYEHQMKTDKPLLDYVLNEKLENVTFVETLPDGTEEKKKYTVKEFNALSFFKGRQAIKAVANYLNSLIHLEDPLPSPEKLEEPFVYTLRKPIRLENTTINEDGKKIQNKITIKEISFFVKTINDVKKILCFPKTTAAKDFFMVAASCKEDKPASFLWNHLSLEDGLTYYAVIYNFFLMD